ncbi:MAG: hypothetical protein ACREDG_07015 [Methylocella sp.]
MFRRLLRFLGLCLLATAFVTLLGDVTRSVAGASLSVTPLGETLGALAPGKLTLAQAFVARQIHPLIWDPVLVDLMRLPVWLAVGAIGCLAIWLGSKPAPRFGFSSR